MFSPSTYMDGSHFSPPTAAFHDMIKDTKEERHLGNRSLDASQVMFEKLHNKSIEREAEMNGKDAAPVPPLQTSDVQTAIMPMEDAKKRSARSTLEAPPLKMLKMSEDGMEVEGTQISFKVVHDIVDMDCCGDTVRKYELMTCEKQNASDFPLTSPMRMGHEVWLSRMAKPPIKIV